LTNVVYAGQVNHRGQIFPGEQARIVDEKVWSQVADQLRGNGASVIRGIQENLQSTGYTLLLANFDEDPAREAAQLATFRAERVRGLIFAASREPAPLYQQLSESGMPMVAVSRALGKLRVDLVTVANRDGAHSAVAHLLECGHTRVALITGPPALNAARERRQGYEDALRDAGLAIDERLIIHCDFRQSAGHDAIAWGPKWSLPEESASAAKLLTRESSC